MRTICGWCKKKLPSSVPTPGRGSLITHGLCDSCNQRILAGYGKPLRRFLDELDVPVLLVDSNVVVLFGNLRARALLKKDLPKMRRRLGGDVIGCMYAGFPGGCGGTVHCKSCTIRRTVADTYATGKSHTGVDAYPDIEVDSRIKHMRLRISTEKIGEVVLLRIDERAEARRRH